MVSNGIFRLGRTRKDGNITICGGGGERGIATYNFLLVDKQGTEKLESIVAVAS